jgi:hypothetical protein
MHNDGRIGVRGWKSTERKRPVGGDRWGPLILDLAPNRWRLRNQAGRSALIINDLRNEPLSVAQLPKLDVAGSSPVARSRSNCESRSCENRLPTSAVGFSRPNGPHNGPHSLDAWGPLLTPGLRRARYRRASQQLAACRPPSWRTAPLEKP